MVSVGVFGAAGILGSTIVRELAHVPDVTAIHLFDVNAAQMEIEATDARALAEKTRLPSLEVVTHTTDMRNVDELAATLDRVPLDAAIQAATARGWYSFPGLFEPQVWKRINHEGRMGPWLPLFLDLPARLMQARKAAGSTVPVVQISYPDAVNAVLDAVGLTPAAGCGNSQNIATIVRLSAAKELGIPVRDVDIELVANHFHAWALAADDPEMAQRPLWLRVYVQNQDVTDSVTTESFWADVRATYPRQRPVFAASSAVQNAMRIVRDDRTAGHINSPAGLPGGVTARLGADGAELLLPAGMSEADVRSMLTTAQQGDGIDGIDPDGSVRISPASAAVMKELIGYDCEVLHFDEIGDRAEELLARLPGGNG